MDWSALGTIVAILLTLMVYSYLVGDNPIFKLAEHILVGVSVGWIFVQVLYNVLIPAISTIQTEATSGTFSLGTLLTYLIPVLLGVVMLFRPIRAAKPLTNLVMAVVIGTVSALSLAGAVAGTIVPQVGANIVNLSKTNGVSDLIGTILLVLGTFLALWYFKFVVSKPALEKEGMIQSNPSAVVQLLGRWSIMLAFGAVFGTVFLTYFAALVDRLVFLLHP